MGGKALKYDWMSKASGRFKKVRFLTRPTPARQDAPFPRARPQVAEKRVPKGATVVASGAYWLYVSTAKGRERRWWLFSTDP